MKVPECLKDALMLAQTQNDEVTVRPKEDGWHIALKSTDTVSLCDILIKAESFEDYAVGEEFAFKAKSLIDALSRTSPAEITVGDRIEVSGRDMKVKLAKYNVNTVFKMPDLDYDATVIVPSDRLRALVAGADTTLTVTLTVSPEGLTAEVADDEGLGTSMSLSADKLTVCSGEAKAHYPLSHVVPLLRALPRDAQLCMELSSDYPVSMSCVMGGWTATMLVAPRIVEGSP